MKLSERERRFVDALMGDAAGNATQAAIAAGYSRKSARRIATRLSTKVHIRAAITARQAVLERASIANAVERQELLTVMLRDQGKEDAARLKAIDLLNKMDGLYGKKHGVTELDVDAIVEASWSVNPDA